MKLFFKLLLAVLLPSIALADRMEDFVASRLKETTTFSGAGTGNLVSTGSAGAGGMIALWPSGLQTWDFQSNALKYHTNGAGIGIFRSANDSQQFYISGSTANSNANGPYDTWEGSSSGRRIISSSATGSVIINSGASDNAALTIDSAHDATSTGNVILNTTGKTLAVDSGTAASACAGTSTHNGTTAVTIATTCAATGMRVLIYDTSEPTTSSTCWWGNIVNGTSFDVDCKSAGQDATFNWWIQKEG